jgi:hypothetical protein
MAVTVHGLSQARAALRYLENVANGRRELNAPVENELTIALMELQRQSQKLAPVREGILRRSARTEVDALAVGNLRGKVSYGGMASAYASVQHEREDFEHPKGGTHHYLYGAPHSPWEKHGPRVFRELQKRVAAQINDGLESASR